MELQERRKEGKFIFHILYQEKKKNLLSWIREMERSENLISFTDAPFQLQKSESDIKIQFEKYQDILLMILLKRKI